MTQKDFLPNKGCERIVFTPEDDEGKVLTHGIGLNWHHNWQPPGAPRDCAPPLEDTDTWNFLFSKLSFLNPHWIRFGYASHRFTDDRGVLDWNAEGFKILDRLNLWAEQNDSWIIFDPWTIPPFHSVGEIGGQYYDAPRDIETYMEEFIRPILDRIEERWSRVDGFILMNEPFYVSGRSFDTPPGIDRFELYAKLHELIRGIIDSSGYDIELIGPNSNNTFYWACEDMEFKGIDFRRSVHALDHHHYTGRFDYLPPNPTTIPTLAMSDLMEGRIRKYVRYASEGDLPYLITEFGTGYYGWSHGDPQGPSTHEAFMTDAEFVVRGAAEGVGGFLRWAYLAPGEYQDGCWQFFDTVDGSLRCRDHTFFGFAALMRYTSRGAVVRKFESSERPGPYVYVHMLGLENPDGTFTLLVVNDHSAEERIVFLKLPDTWSQSGWQRFTNDRVRKMWRSVPLMDDRIIRDCLPPMSLTVYTTRHLEGDDGFPDGNNVFTEV